MSGVLPPPPPPSFPELIHPPVYQSSVKKVQDLPYEKENLWAYQFPEIQKACYFSRSRISCKPKSCVFYEIPSILQDGPTCGLTAVSMMLLGNPSPDEILKRAKSRNFTNFGEMFSTENLHKIIEEVVPNHIKSKVLDGSLDCMDFKDELIAGSIALVTYPLLFTFCGNIFFANFHFMPATLLPVSSLFSRRGIRFCEIWK